MKSLLALYPYLAMDQHREHSYRQLSHIASRQIFHTKFSHTASTYISHTQRSYRRLPHSLRLHIQHPRIRPSSVISIQRVHTRKQLHTVFVRHIDGQYPRTKVATHRIRSSYRYTVATRKSIYSQRSSAMSTHIVRTHQYVHTVIHEAFTRSIHTRLSQGVLDLTQVKQP